MKKRILIAVFALLLAFTAFGETFDIAPIRASEYVTIDVNAEADVAFVESVLSVANRSFVHSKESALRYSTTMWDLILINYFENDTYPVLRCHIYLCTDDKPYYITSATITIGGKDYTFSGISDPEWFTNYEDGYNQSMLIKFGMDNLDFLMALDTAFEGVDSDHLEDVKFDMVLHGTEDITAQLDAGFLLDYKVIEDVFLDSNGIYFLDKAYATEMKVTDAQ